jgi:hypothetical protein
MCTESMSLLLTLGDLLARPNLEVEHHAVEVDIIRKVASGFHIVKVFLHGIVQCLKEPGILPGKVKVQVGDGVTIEAHGGVGVIYSAAASY